MATRRSGRKPKILYGRRDEDPDEASTEEEEAEEEVEEEEEVEVSAKVDEKEEDEKEAIKSGGSTPGVRRKIVLNLKNKGGCKVKRKENQKQI